ncbi:MAG: 8-oxo-dGTP pyrophosphatase MutT (NUDIX family) [Saprospiraceae bacterium]|jgi:8-oxo-dGTP pyrophosphatase MutT (NUDIX family)|tara:strand:+ start:713 stop:1348 length:636 start_codon:yes stop_codon:yes gene_type:complete
MNYITTNILQKLKDSLALDLPGQHFQNLMSPVESHEKYRIVPKEHKVACVMALIHPKSDGQLYITYIERASTHSGDKHAGQIGFPGGKFEEEDDSLIVCALREVEEELGLNMNDIQVLGELTSLYVFASNFLVYPFVGYLEYEPKYIPQIEEVAGVIEVPLSLLRDSKYKTSKKMKLDAGSELVVPGYNVDGSFLWGATAMISRELEELLP